VTLISTPRATLSVVIPAYQSVHLARVLESAQKLDPDEIVVVDSSPDEPVILDATVTLKRLPSRTWPAGARNHGAESATSDFLLFVDSDVELTDNAIAFIDARLRSGDSDPICGVYVSSSPKRGAIDEFQDAFLRYRLLRAGRREGRPGGTSFTSTSHMLIRRDLFALVGGFNPELETYEDLEFSARSSHYGSPVTVAQEFQAIHLKKFTFVSLLRDYAVKCFNGFLARRRYPGVFESSRVGLGPTLLSCLVAGCLLPLVAGGLVLIGGFGPTEVALLGTLIAAPTAMWPKVLRGTSWQVKGTSLVLWPAVSWAVATGLAVGFLSWIARRLFRHALRALDWVRAGIRVMSRSGMPVQIVHFVTARCNLRCEHCFYKESLDAPNPGEISLDTLERTTQDIGPVLWYSLAGGEPVLRSDLADVVGVVQKRCRPKVFSFPTNGWFVERTYLTVLRSLQKMDGGNLVVFFSFDGPESVHDEIRGKDSFKRAFEAFARLKPLQSLYPELHLNVITTVMPQNAPVASQFIDQIVRELEPNAISINLFRYHSLEHPPIPPDVLDAYEAATAVYQEHLERGRLAHYGFAGRRFLAAKEVLKSEVILRVARDDAFVTPCTAGTLSYVINEDGAVSACEILDPNQNLGWISGTQRKGQPLRNSDSPSGPVPVSLGRVDTGLPPEESHKGVETFREIVTSRRAQELRTWIDETKCRCTYECAMTTNTLFSWPLSRQLYLRTGRSFLQRKVVTSGAGAQTSMVRADRP